jgi:hypothetical protein
MSTGNPNEPHVGPGAPGAGPQWPADAGNLRRADDHGGGGGVNPDAVRAGHEPDMFAVKPIFSIPVAVVVTFGIATAVAIAAFVYLMAVPKDPMVNPQAAERNNAPLNDRLGRIGRGTETDQPRLEPLRRMEEYDQTARQPALTTPPLAGGVKAGNSPELHAEDLRPERIADPKNPNAADWTDKDRAFAGKIVEAAKSAGGSDAVRSALFPVRKEQVKPDDTSRIPSYSSGGRGTKPAAAHDDHDHEKKDDHKEPDKAKDGDKKKETAPMPTPKGETPKKQ